MQPEWDEELNISFYKTDSFENGVTVLLIHGLGCSGRWFEFEENRPQVKFNWLVPDLFGYGLSKSNQMDSDSLTMKSQAEKLFELLRKHCSKEERVVIYAHSMGGPIAVHLIEQIIQCKEKPCQLLGLAFAEGNVNADDCFGSGKMVAVPFEQYRNGFDEKLQKLKNECKDSSKQDIIKRAAGDPHLDPIQLERTGAFVMYASAVSLVEESHAEKMIPRLKSICEQTNVVFIIGEENRGKLSSEDDLREAGLLQHEIKPDCRRLESSGDVLFVENTAHGMHYHNRDAFWPRLQQVVDLCVVGNK